MENKAKISVFGAGKMGTGIALQFAVTGFPVKLLAFDVREQQTSAGVIEDNLKLLAENGLVDADRCDEIRKRIDIVLDFDEAAREADFAIECVLENMELKQNYFARLDQACKPGAVLCTNTSAMSVTEIASKSVHRERILGTHFWNPPFLIPLVEVVRTADVSDHAVDAVCDVLREAGKKPIVVKKDVPGFIANRMQNALGREAVSIIDNSYDFVLDSNGYVIAVRPAEEIVTNYALVIDSAWTLNALDRSGQVKILMTDGTVKTYSINWKNSAKAMEDITGITAANDVNSKSNDVKLETYLGTRDVNQPGSGSYNKTGVAAGSIITYTLSDDDVLTIKSVLQGNSLKGTGSEIDSTVNSDSTAGVGDDGNVIRMDTTNNGSLQYKAMNGYTGGRGSINVTAHGQTQKTYAVDKNTVAFYYWTNTKGEIEYGVATGWDHMSDVNPGVDVQVYPVLDKTSYKTYEATDLADVILFEAEAKATSANYMLVLSANAIGKDLLELNVVFEDGTVQAIEVDDDGGHDWDDEASYMKAYTYAENADGTYDIGDDVENAGTAKLLKNGTVDSSLKGYIALSGKANVWDVTDVDTAEDKTALGTFPYNTKVNAVIVEDDNAIRTAWIWEVDEEHRDDGIVNESITVQFDPMTRKLNISVTGAEDATFAEKRDAVKAEAAKVLGVSVSDIEVEVDSTGNWVIKDTKNGDNYTCTTTDNHVTVTTADKNAHLEYTEYWKVQDPARYGYWVDLVNSGYVTFDFDIVATGSNAITVSGPVTGTSVNTKVPGFGTDPANPAETIAQLYCTGGSATSQNDLKNSTEFAVLAFYDEAGAAQYMLVGNDAAYTPNNLTINGTTYTVTLDLDW